MFALDDRRKRARQFLESLTCSRLVEWDANACRRRLKADPLSTVESDPLRDPVLSDETGVEECCQWRTGPRSVGCTGLRGCRLR